MVRPERLLDAGNQPQLPIEAPGAGNRPPVPRDSDEVADLRAEQAARTGCYLPSGLAITDDERPVVLDPSFVSILTPKPSANTVERYFSV